MNRHERQSTIRDIITQGGESTQEEIRESLLIRGIDISQSTLSRDLREIGAVKVPLADGGFSYLLDRSQERGAVGDEMARAMNEYALKHEQIGNFLVINTKAGNARDLCLVIDRQRWREIVGTIAGDDTILVMARTARDVTSVRQKLHWDNGKD